MNQSLFLHPDQDIVTLPRGIVLGAMIALTLITIGLVVPLWDWTYWDFGDGNYLYIGKRINDGLVPYQDILAPQPPLHLIMCAWSQKVGQWIFDSGLLGARAYCLIVRLLGIWVVFWAGRTWFRTDAHGLCAAMIYAFLPIGFWWSICIQSENLEILLLMIGFVGVLKLDKRWLLIGGVASGLAMHVNMTALPYFLCNVIFLVVRRPKLSVWYLATALPVWGIGAGIAWMWAGYDYLDNILLNQVGSFPREDITGEPFVSYAYEKISSQTKEVLAIEWIPIVVAFVALVTRWMKTVISLDRKTDEYRKFEYAAWYSIGMLLSICFTAKGGTVNYIFVLGEPAVALLAADGVMRFVSYASGTWKYAESPPIRKVVWSIALVALSCFCLFLLKDYYDLYLQYIGAARNISILAYLVGILVSIPLSAITLMILGFTPVAGWLASKNDMSIIARGLFLSILLFSSYHTTINLYMTLTGQQAEQTLQTIPDAMIPFVGFDYGVEDTKVVIEAYTEPGDMILSPPFFAYATDRLVAAEIAENYLWYIKYINEAHDVENGLAEPGAGMAKHQEVADMIRRQEIPLILLDPRLTGVHPGIQNAIARYYQPANPPLIKTRHVPMQVYIPKVEAE